MLLFFYFFLFFTYTLCTYVRSMHILVLIYVCIGLVSCTYVRLRALCTPNMRGWQIITRLEARYKSWNCCLTQCHKVTQEMLVVLQKSLLSLAGIRTYVYRYTKHNIHTAAVPSYSRCTSLVWLWLPSDSGANFNLD